ncbi:MAG: Mrp/NBP35 family ATP-binding protein [Eggerthellaceae bacterium]|nr:Mrp/NBP35 family ATP-binding protein [Eggerthellaceae bacterium]
MKGLKISENYTQDCTSCSKECSDRQSEILKPNKNSNIKNLIAVVSGKGGVGKSITTALLACALRKGGLKVGILDADLTGPSIPKEFGLQRKAKADEDGLIPVESKEGIKIISINFLLDGEDSPVAWRGPVISGVMNQFFTEVNWGNLDVLLIDMPPGTSDVFLTVFNMLPVDYIIMVSIPSDVAGIIVGKAANLANTMEKNILALIENMAYFECDECKKKHYIFGNPAGGDLCKKYGIKTLAQLPLDPELVEFMDKGKIEDYSLKGALNKIVELVKVKLK